MMAQDRKLNPDQWTAGELMKLIKKAGGFESQGEVSAPKVDVEGGRVEWSHRKNSRGGSRTRRPRALLAISIASWLASLPDPASVAIAVISHVHFFSRM